METSRPVWAIPSEVTEHTLSFCHPRDVAVFSRTCLNARDLIYRSPDQYLWRQLFLIHFDDPRRATQMKHSSRDNSHSKYNWKDQLQIRIRVESVDLESAAPSKGLGSACAVFFNVLEEALPYVGPDDQGSLNIQWLAKVLHNVNVGVDQDIPQTLHRLLSYLSLSNRDFFCYRRRQYTYRPGDPDEDVRHEYEPLRTISRCFVYDLQNYTAHTRYGPYLDSATINWKHHHYNINVVLMNLREFQRMWPGVRPPICMEGLGSLRAYSAPGTLEKRHTRDWAGVEGHWRRFVCFMDYRDLFSFNICLSPFAMAQTGTQFGNLRQMPGRGARDGSYFSKPNFQEATRLVETELQLIELSEDPGRDADREFSFIGHPRGCRALHPDDPPPLHFVGVSRGSNGNESNVKGCVRMEAGGIRWRWTDTKVSIYDSNTQWSAEGVQVGQICSAAGIVGNWTGAYHEEGDPAGPFWLWKVPDDFQSLITDVGDE